MRGSAGLLALLALAACGAKPDGVVEVPGTCDPVDWYRDADGDGYGAPDSSVTACAAPAGYVADLSDCDDGSSGANPAAEEVCGGGDEDCDGAIDEAGARGERAWYADTDADGYGDANTTRTRCEVPPGFVPDASDCDDTSSWANPTGIEVCGGGDEDCDGRIDENEAVDAPTWYADTDGDGYGDPESSETACDAAPGYVADASDCDDTSDATHPTAAEVCGGADENCDGAIDEDDAVDVGTWYADGDGDGYGDAGASTSACDAPSDYVADASDCDDADDSVNPSEVELCGGGDEDCDGAVDEDDASDAGTWYADADGDGFGDPAARTNACAAPTGYLADATDCDDTDATSRPGGTEVCGGGDEDCDGTVDEDDASDAGTWFADTDGDGYGDPDSSATACAVPTGFIADASDCDDRRADVNPGAVEVCDDGIDQDCDPDPSACRATGSNSLATHDARLTGFIALGYVSEGHDVGDVTGDGVRDLLVLCPNPWGYLPVVPAARLMPGPVSGDASLSTAWTTFTDASTDLGSSGAGEIDFDRDGNNDVLLGTEYVDDDSGSSDTVYGFRGPVSAGTTSASSADLTITALGSIGSFGTSFARADTDGDGFEDLVLGAGLLGSGGYPGGAYLFTGALSGAMTSLDATGTVLSDADDAAGRVVASPGDVDGDGLDDLLLGAPRQNSSSTYPGPGQAYLFLSPVSGTMLTSDADATLVGETDEDEAGFGLSGAGDQDGDGLPDLLVGAPYYGGLGQYYGSAYLIPGATRGTLSLADAGTIFRGDARYDEVGWSLADGDADGDGQADLGVGAYDHTTTRTSDGVVYLFYGPVASGTLSTSLSADASFHGEMESDRAGYGVSFGDLDEDGLSDLIIAALFGNEEVAYGGAVYVVRGHGE